MKKTITFVFGIFLVLLLAPFVSAAGATWLGTATIGGTAAANGTRVDLYVGDSLFDTKYVGQQATTPAEFKTGQYMIPGDMDSGKTITFKIWGVAITEGTQTWTGGSHELDISITKLANGASCLYSQACSGNYCCSGSTEVSGTSGTCQATTCSGGGGGGTPSPGGGGGDGSTAQDSQMTYIWASIPAGSSGTMNINNVGIAFISITVTPTTTLLSPSINAVGSISSETIASISGMIILPGTAYQYLKITPTGMTDAQVSQILIKFKVLKAWLISKGFVKTDISLFRFADNKWVELTTTITSEDTDYVYYSAVTPGFSYFAIGTKKTGPVAPVEQPPAEEVTPPAEELPPTEGVTPTEEQPPAEEVTPVVEKKTSVWTWIGAGILAIIVIAVIVYFALKPKKPGHHTHHEHKEEET